MTKRVVVTGIGSLTPIGNSQRQSWNSLMAGKSGIGPITRFETGSLPWKTAGELKGFDPAAYLAQKELNRTDLFTQYAVAAAVMAAEDASLIFSKTASLKVNSPLNSAGLIIGSSRGGVSTMEKALTLRRFSPYTMPATTVSMAASYIAQKLKIKGYCLGISNACASGTNAVGEAYRLIKDGYLSLALAGGTEAPICRSCVKGYGIAGALSRRDGAAGPFDQNRDGFVLSEGACIMALEDYEHAVNRNAGIYGEILGYGNVSDAFHMTRPDPAGEADAIAVALKGAGVTNSEIDYINTHGTGTVIGDIAEARAVSIVFSEKAAQIPASAIKSMTGHMLAASGAFEIAATFMSMKERVIPPTINLTQKDPGCDINIIIKSMPADIRLAISSSFGFGGVNAVIVLKSI